MLKLYRVGTHIFQYEEGEQPKGAEEVIEGRYQPSFQKKQGAVTKTQKPSNKSRAVKNK